MNHKLLKKTLLATAMLSSLNSQAAFLSVLSKSMGTINPEAKISGPVYRHETKKEDQYGDEVAKILLEEAHKQAKEYLAEGNTEAYYAFMILALTVPNQEGLYVHFREVPAQEEYCRDKRTQGDGISGESVNELFKVVFNNHKPVPEELKDVGFFRGLFGGKKLKERLEQLEKENQEREKNGFLLPCSKMTGNESTYRQLILGGWDGSDVGMMQVSVKFHYDKFLKPKKYQSVRETIQYGLGYIKKRFDVILGKNTTPTYIADPESSYVCFTDENGKVNYQAVVQGSWAAYNGGPAQRCRFTRIDDPENEYAGHDKGFLVSMKKTTDLNKGRFFGFNEEGQLPLSETMKKALAEVVTNYEQKTNNRQHISQIVGE